MKMLMEIDPLLMRGSLVMTMVMISPSWREVSLAEQLRRSPRLVRCHLGASVKIVELNQGVCKGKEIAYFMKIYPSEASPSWAMAMVG